MKKSTGSISGSLQNLGLKQFKKIHVSNKFINFRNLEPGQWRKFRYYTQRIFLLVHQFNFMLNIYFCSDMCNISTTTRLRLFAKFIPGRHFYTTVKNKL